MKCIWTKRAIAEYKHVVKYIAGEFGRNAALNFINEIENHDENICKYPEIGAPEPLLADRINYVYRSFIVSKHNKVIYTIDKQGKVTIVDMWDMRREPQSLSYRIKSK